VTAGADALATAQRVPLTTATALLDSTGNAASVVSVPPRPAMALPTFQNIFIAS
jgi:hypothetical protein